MTNSTSTSTSTILPSNINWEEWDRTNDPFWVHCLAGSIAGVIEHGALYPLDTIRTHIQVCASWVITQQRQLVSETATTASAVPPAATTTRSSSLPLGVWQTIQYLVHDTTTTAAISASDSTTTSTVVSAGTSTSTSSGGYIRLWRGFQTVLFGCAPSHAFYFATYESVKSFYTDKQTNTISPFGSSLAGAAATVGHDTVMTPMDTIKQRLQLGHYNGSITEAFTTITKTEGYNALYRSLPVTLATKIPYHMIMVTTNEQCKQYLTKKDNNNKSNNNVDIPTILISGSIAGFVASAGTTPLDRIKTTLQTQQLYPNCIQGQTIAKKVSLSDNNIIKCQRSWYIAAQTIYTNEGLHGFFRGLTPRVISHTPAVAISWTAYETIKRYILKSLE